MNIIITADDYGMSKSVNKAIKELVTIRTITSMNVMTNMEYYHDFSSIRKINPDLSIGIHWTLTAGRPVSDKKDVPSLVDDKGNFYSYPEFRKRYRQHLIIDDDIIKELKEQYKIFYALSGIPDYWNTHQNVHVDFKIFQLFVKLASEFHIPKMRSHQRLYVPSSNKGKSSMPITWRMIEPVKSKILDNWQSKAHEAGIGSPDGLIVCLNPMDNDNLQYTFHNIQWGKKKCGEYVIHPATSCDSPFFGRIGAQRIKEYKMFSDKRVLETLAKNDINLTYYQSI